MARKKKAVKKDLLKAGFVEGYDVSWIKRNPEHPDYDKVKKAAKKAKIW